MRIEQSTGFLSQQLRCVEQGRLVPASFQRPYVWDEAAVLAFVESILRGYPVGGFLLWTPGEDVALAHAARARLGPVARSDAHARVSLLLDGQNRLATLAWIGMAPETELPADLSAAEVAVWGSDRRLVLDLHAQTIAFVAADEADQGLKLPACAAVHSAWANAYIRKAWDTTWASYSDAEKDAALQWLSTVQYAFQEARVTVTDIQGATAQEAKDAFLHICRVGVPMSAQDLDHALGWAL